MPFCRFVMGVASMSQFLLIVIVRGWLVFFLHNKVSSRVVALWISAFVFVCFCWKGLHACGSPSAIYILKRLVNLDHFDLTWFVNKSSIYVYGL